LRIVQKTIFSPKVAETVGRKGEGTAAPENPEKKQKDRIAFLTAYSLPGYIEETRVWVNDTLPRLPTLDIGRGGVKTKGGADGFD